MRRFCVGVTITAFLLSACGSPSQPTLLPTESNTPATTLPLPSRTPIVLPSPQLTATSEPPAATGTAKVTPLAAPPTATETPSAAAELWVVEKQGLNLRATDSVNGTFIKLLNYGQHVTAVGTKTGPDAKGFTWLNIRTDDGQMGWVAAETRDGSNLSSTNPNPPTTPASPVVTVTLTATSTPAAADLWVVEKQGLNLRATDSVDGTFIKLLNYGQHVTAVGTKTGPDAKGFTWLNIRTDDGQIGWVAAETRDGSNLSSTNPNPPTTPASPVVTVTLTATSTPALTPTPTPLSSSRRDLWVNTRDGLNFRNDAKASARLISVLKFGQHLIALEGSLGPDADGITWQQVQTDDGQKGWVAAVFLSPTAPLTPTPTPTP